MPPSSTNPQRTPVLGVFVDPMTSKSGSINPSTKVEVAVGYLVKQVASTVTATYDLDPPLNPFEMTSKYFPAGLEQSQEVSATGPGGSLITLVTPNAQQSERIKARVVQRAIVEKENQILADKSKRADDSDKGSRLASGSGAKQSKPNPPESDTTYMNRKIDTMMNIINSLRSEVEEGKNARMAQDRRLEGIQGELKEEKTGRRQDIQTMQGELKEEKTGRRKDIQTMQGELKGVQGELKGVRGELKGVQGELKGVRGELKEEKTGRRKDIQAMQGELKESETRSQAQVTKLEEETNGLRSKVQDLENLLQKEKAERKDDVESLRRLTSLLTPIHLRLLLDKARWRVLDHFKIKTWEELHGESVASVTDLVYARLQGTPLQLPRDIVNFICTDNQVRQDGNFAAHKGDEADVRAAVMTKDLNSKDRGYLEQIFKFVYGNDV